MSESVKITSGAFKSLLGMETTNHANPTKQPDNIAFVSRFSKVEAETHIKGIYTNSKSASTNISPGGFISYLKPIHKQIGEQMLDVEKMRALAPEIEQSRILVSSSILSPNDLQDGEFKFSFPEVPGVDSDPELASDIADVYSKFFNEVLELGLKSYDWIGKIQYSSGSVPVLILPCASQAEIVARTNEDVRKDLNDIRPGFASFDAFAKSVNRDDDYLYSGKPLTFKDVLSNTRPKEMLSELTPSMESFGVQIPTQFMSGRATTQSNIYGKDYVDGLESMIVTLKSKLEEGDVLRVSENPEIVRFTTQKKNDDKNSILGKIHDKYSRLLPTEQLISIKPNPGGKHFGHPAILELPPESVIPIHIPGAPSEHIGYFILLDQYGQPLTIEASGMANTGSKGCSPGSASGAYEAMFGSTVHQNYFGSNNAVSSSGNMIFQHLLDKYLKERMRNITGRGDLEISRMNAISSMLFYRVLEQKNTTMIYVPPPLLQYLAFDFRKNGTGKSKLEDVQFLLSLRTTLLMAQIVAMVNDAVEHKKVEFGVDDKNANLEMIMDLIGNIFIAKNKINGSIDPSEIMRDMYSNALTIVPKNIPGLADMTVEVQNGGGQSTKPDNELLEQITNLLVSHLDVPPAALNQMSEPEFAKSLVTYNLFFAKKIARYQRIWCTLMQDFIRTYTAFDPKFQAAVHKVLETNGKKKAGEKLPSEVEKLKKKNPNKYSEDLSSTLSSILEGVVVSLPSPNIVVDKTQFEELRAFMSNLDELANNLFNQDLIPTDDTVATSALPIIRAKWKRSQMMRFIEEVGSFNMVEIPSMDDVDPEEIFDFIQTCQNIGKGLVQQRENILGASDSGGFGDTFGGGESMGGEDDGMGGMDDMGGDMGDMGAMDDTGGEMPEEPTEPEPVEEPTSESEEPEEKETPTASMYLDMRKHK